MKTLLAAAALVGLAGAALADPAIDAFNRQDFATAMRIWRAEAESGNPASQLRVGDMYMEGRGVKADPVEAVRWYRMAADQRYTTGQETMGNVYHYGKGVPRDYAEAARWYALVANRGSVSAQYHLARFYAEGRGVPLDLVQAYKWFTLAGNAPLGRAALASLNRQTLAERDAVAAKMTAEQIAEAERLAREWQPKW